MLEDTTANPAAGLVMPHPAGGSTGGYGIPSAGRAPLPSASECPFGTATAACRGWPSWFSLEAAADELRSVETPSEFLRVCWHNCGSSVSQAKACRRGGGATS